MSTSPKETGVGEVVPFGKYRGKPVDEMLADGEYMTWLEGQTWFRQKYAALANLRKDALALAKTPDHNRLQVLFLDDLYVAAFAEAADKSITNFKNIAQNGLLEHIKDASKQAEDQEAIKPYAAAHSTIEGVRAALSNKDTARRLMDQTSYSYYFKNWPFAEDDENIEAIIRHIAATMQTKLEQAEERLTSLYKAIAAMRGAGAALSFTFSKKFEAERVINDFRSNHKVKRVTRDVMLSVEAAYTSWNKEWNGYGKECMPGRSARATEYAVEIKPSIGDDYPLVMRQMNANMSRYLFVQHFDAESLTKGQMVQMFAASGFTVVFKSDVDAEYERMKAAPPGV